MLINADCFEALKDLADNSIESVVTDPPYGLGACTPAQVAECLQAWSSGKTWKPKGSGFMGKAWDAWVPPPELWREVLRVLKPGGHGLIFAGSRTQDLMGMSLRLAGFEMRDVVQWIHSMGFPKSHDISKSIDKMAGAKRPVIGKQKMTGTARRKAGGGSHGCAQSGVTVKRIETRIDLTAPSTSQAKQWDGWGTALKPAYEPALLVRKPMSDTVAQNTLKYGCGGLNIDGCRIETTDQLGQATGGWKKGGYVGGDTQRWNGIGITKEGGRFPSNIILDEQASEQLEQQKAKASRFFYCAKASMSEREEGLSGGERVNIHPTVKPIDLMRYLIRLITPPHGTVLDPFMGSGSTGCAAALEGVNFIGIEREPEYFTIAQQRVAYWGGDVEALEYPPESKPEQSDTLPLFDWLDG
jgi:site-specific DNA-methyltransferase (adenine-specific)